MIEVYVHTIYYINGATQSFDSDKPINFERNQFCTLCFSNGDLTVINTAQVNCVDIKHVTFTEEQYEARRKILNKEV